MLLRTRIKYISLLLAGAALNSCVKTVVSISQDSSGDLADDAIRFESSVRTKAVKNDFTVGDSFTVWGYCGKTSSAADMDGTVFGGEAVTKNADGNWTYGGALRKWENGNTYRFYALYPPADELSGSFYSAPGNKEQIASEADATPDGIAIKDFDARSGLDLLTSCYQRAFNGINSGPVDLTFSHVLSRLEFAGNISPSTHTSLPDFEARIISAALYGQPFLGDYTLTGESGKWTLAGKSVTTPSDPFASFVSNEADGAADTGPSPIEIAGGNVVLALEDVLTFPQTLTEGISFTVKYQTRVGRDAAWSETKEHTENLALYISEWQAGKYYRFSFYITDDDYILFDVPVVDSWDEATGGIIVVE